MPKIPIPADCTETERWIWDRIAAGEPADLNAREPDSKKLNPHSEEDWGEDRRLRAKFLQTILTQKTFVEATPFYGARIHGALIDDGPLKLAHARLPYQFSLERSRILVDVEGSDLRVDGGLSLEGSYVAGRIKLSDADIKPSFNLNGSTIIGKVDLTSARISSDLLMADNATFEGQIVLDRARVSVSAFLCSSTFRGKVDLRSATIGSHLEMQGSTFQGRVSLNGATVNGPAFLRSKAVFQGEVDFRSASIGTLLDLDGSRFENGINLGGATVGGSLMMQGSTFLGRVSLNGAKVNGPAVLRSEAVFQDEVDLMEATIGSTLDLSSSRFENDISLAGASIGASLGMQDSTFQGLVNLNGITVNDDLDLSNSKFKTNISLLGASFGSKLSMMGSTFQGDVQLMWATVGNSLFLMNSTFQGLVNLTLSTVSGAADLRAATFQGQVHLVSATTSSDLDFSNAHFFGDVNLTGIKVGGEFRLGSSQYPPTRWEDGTKLVLRNAHVGALQDWWRDKHDNAWPNTLELQGFTYDRLSGLFGEGKEANLLTRPVANHIQWLNRDPSFSTQPYKYLARLFREAGEPSNANDILYAARERQRRRALSKVDDYGRPKKRQWRQWLGLSVLSLTIGYGLGNKYFRVLWSVGGLTLLGTLILLIAESPSLTSESPSLLTRLPVLAFASLDQLLPIVTLNKTHDALIFCDQAAKQPICPQPYGVEIYFYVQKILGWMLGSFLVAGLAGLTQRS